MKNLALVLLVFTSLPVFAKSRCHVDVDLQDNPVLLSCTHREVRVDSGAFTSRVVKYELPEGTPPAGGWPAVVIYQGTFFTVEFSRAYGVPLGGYYEAELIRQLLDHGFAVLAPRATLNFAWITNIAGSFYEQTSDYVFLSNVFEKIRIGEFGPINSEKLFATGISSGGYNTSRMALSFPNVFKALAIQSASYATCLGPKCEIPVPLPANHPPTLLLHGLKDHTVPAGTAVMYDSALKASGIERKLVLEPEMTHEWFPDSPKLILDWFQSHLEN